MVAISEVKSMFWGVTLHGGKRYSQLVENSFHISMAALEPTKNDVPKEERIVSVMLQHEKSEFLLCTLEVGKHHQQPLDLNFTEGEEVVFFLNGGKGVVHLTGYLVGDDKYDSDLPLCLSGSEEDMSTDEEVSDDDEEESDEYDDVPTLQAITAAAEEDEDEDEDFIPKSKESKRKKATHGKNAKKIKVERMEVEEDEDSEDESDYDSDDEYTWFDDSAANFEDYEEGDSEDEDDDEDESDEDDTIDEEAFEKLKLLVALKKTPKSEKAKPQTPKSSKKDVKQELSKSAVKEVLSKTPKSAKEENSAPTPKSVKKANPLTPKSVNDQLAATATPKQAENNAQETPKSKKKKKKKKNAAQGEATPQAQTPQANHQNKTPKDQTPQQPKKPVKKVIKGGIVVEELKEGHGPEAKHGKTVAVNYTGCLTNGKQFDSNKGGPEFKFKLGKNEVIKGWDLGLQGMKVGGRRKLTVPAAMAYGKEKLDGIPPNSTLVFDVELNKVS